MVGELRHGAGAAEGVVVRMRREQQDDLALHLLDAGVWDSLGVGSACADREKQRQCESHWLPPRRIQAVLRRTYFIHASVLMVRFHQDTSRKRLLRLDPYRRALIYDGLRLVIGFGS